jgi:hypothetical protein
MLPVLYLIVVALVVSLTVGRLMRGARFAPVFLVSLFGALAGMISGGAVGAVVDVLTGGGAASFLFGALAAPFTSVAAVLAGAFLRALAPR